MNVKTTIELPDTLFRSAKVRAAQEGISLRIFFERAVSSQLHQKKSPVEPAPAWRRSFGKLQEMKTATRDLQRVVDREFSTIEAEAWK